MSRHAFVQRNVEKCEKMRENAGGGIYHAVCSCVCEVGSKQLDRLHIFHCSSSPFGFVCAASIRMTPNVRQALELEHLNSQLGPSHHPRIRPPRAIRNIEMPSFPLEASSPLHHDNDGSKRHSPLPFSPTYTPSFPSSVPSLPNCGSAATSSITPHSTGTNPSKTYTGWPSNRTLGRAGCTVGIQNERLVHCRPTFVYVLANMVPIFRSPRYTLSPASAHLTG
ncbi:uncharacterized protein B0T23DRAFT_153530 [Neurospora hispaniola]|uniref:Uncharacterized protein n=1 Tax=Neurospora hispaniola TaxID=588809 RepID=A0AAJ0I8M0_9PEZI|nr:hypothetical protein B0T23DRAFT_153530 [Neurospora hispaniola]